MNAPTAPALTPIRVCLEWRTVRGLYTESQWCLLILADPDLDPGERASLHGSAMGRTRPDALRALTWYNEFRTGRGFRPFLMA